MPESLSSLQRLQEFNQQCRREREQLSSPTPEEKCKLVDDQKKALESLLAEISATGSEGKIAAEAYTLQVLQRMVVIDGKIPLDHDALRRDREELQARLKAVEEKRLLDGIMEGPSEPPPDGPIIPDGFRCKGVVHSGLSKQACNVLDALWPQKGRQATFDSLKWPVHGDHAKDVTKDHAGYIRKTANRFFHRKAIPYRVTVDKKRGLIQVAEGLPKPRPRKPRPRKSRPR